MAEIPPSDGERGPLIIYAIVAAALVVVAFPYAPRLAKALPRTNDLPARRADDRMFLVAPDGETTIVSQRRTVTLTIEMP